MYLLHKIDQASSGSVWIKISIQYEFCIHACVCAFIVESRHEIEKTSFIRVFVSLFYRNINCDLFNAGWKASDDNAVAIYSHVSFLCSHHKWDQGQCIFCLNGPIEQWILCRKELDFGDLQPKTRHNKIMESEMLYIV